MFDQLLADTMYLDQCIVSSDGRLLISGRIVIKLNYEKDNVDDLGCIACERFGTILNYKFFSLLKDKDKEKIKQLVKKPITLKSIIEFKHSSPPIQNCHLEDVLYFPISLTDVLLDE